MSKQAWGTAMQMRGYRGSTAEREDRAAGIKVGGKVQWGVPGDAIPATIRELKIDEHGDPRFTLTFDGQDVQDYFKSKGQEGLHDGHKDITVDREEIFPMGF